MASKDMHFELNPQLDAATYADTLAKNGRVVIPDVLSSGAAENLHGNLRSRSDWLQVINSGDKLIELSRETRANLSDTQRQTLDQAVYAGAREGFQYRYETIRIPDDEKKRHHSTDPLSSFATWWSTGEARDLLRQVTARPDICFADAQGTAFSPGDFLTGHDDEFAGKERVAAYVLSLTPKWRLEWGGLLVFHEHEDGWLQGLAPAFNQLHLFQVGQMHSVTEVTRSAAYRRYSITGWLRL